MPVTPGFLGIDEPATIDKRADTNTMTRAATAVHREVVSIGSPDDATPESITKVDSTGSLRTVSTDAAGTNQQAITAAGDAKVTLDGEQVDVSDRAARDNGKVDIALLDQYTPQDVDTGAPIVNALPVVLKKSAAGAPDLGTSTDPMRIDPTGTTIQPVSGTVTANAGTGTRDVQGNVAHDAVDSGNPVKIGGIAKDTNPIAVANDDRVNAYFDRQGRQIVRPWGGSLFQQVHFPAVNTRATSTKAAGGAGNRNVCTGLTVVLAGGATAPAAIQLDVRLRDGIADTGTILWQAVITLPATAGAMNGIALSGLHITGTANTAMTLEFSAAGGANTFESVSFQGTTIVEA